MSVTIRWRGRRFLDRSVVWTCDYCQCFCQCFGFSSRGVRWRDAFPRRFRGNDPAGRRGRRKPRGDTVRIALFVTCLADALFPGVGRSTVRLLERLGHRVEFPQVQTCCGQMHINTGYGRDALPLVRHYVEVFEPCEVIVASSGSCVGSVRQQYAVVARRCGDATLPAFLRSAELAGGSGSGKTTVAGHVRVGARPRPNGISGLGWPPGGRDEVRHRGRDPGRSARPTYALFSKL